LERRRKLENSTGIAMITESKSEIPKCQKCGAEMVSVCRDLKGLVVHDAELKLLIDQVPAGTPRVRICRCRKCGTRRVETINQQQIDTDKK
jgi:Zn ribbon nucleic-acid-binding protein